RRSPPRAPASASPAAPPRSRAGRARPPSPRPAAGSASTPFDSSGTSTTHRSGRGPPATRATAPATPRPTDSPPGPPSSLSIRTSPDHLKTPHFQAKSEDRLGQRRPRGGYLTPRNPRRSLKTKLLPPTSGHALP